MSYWVYLKDPKTTLSLRVEQHSEGGTHALDGIDLAELNVTYNYSKWFGHLHSDGLRWLDGKRAFRTRARLARAVAYLGTKQDDSYWNPTKGNAGHALSILLEWAKQHPHGVWMVH